MSKRKSSTNLRHVLATPGRKLSVGNIQTPAMNITRRKSGTSNVRPTSSYKVRRGHAGDTQRGSASILLGTRKSNVVRNEASDVVRNIPKTRFHMTSGWNTYTPRLKNFPVECVKKTVAGWSYSPSLLSKLGDKGICKQSDSPSVGASVNTRPPDLVSHGNGDALEHRLTGDLIKRSQENGTRDSPEQALTISQPHMTTELYVGKIHQSEAIPSKRVASPGRPIHRPFVHNVALGVPRLLDCSSHKSTVSPRLPDRQGSVHGIVQGEQCKQEQVSSATSEQVPVHQQGSQVARQSVVDQLTQKSHMLVRNKNPWNFSESSMIPDYNVQPIGGKIITAPCVTPVVNEQPGTQQNVVTTQQPVNISRDPSNSTGMHQCTTKSRHYPQHQQLHQQPQHQYPTQQIQNNVQTLQNPRQIHQRLQTNIIHQQKMQQKALCHQQQMTLDTQQQMRQQPFAHQSPIPVQRPQINRETYGNYYDPEQIHRSRMPNLSTGSEMLPPWDIHTNKMNIPHYRTLMQERDTGYKLAQVSPIRGWAHNCEVISEHPSERGRLKAFAYDPVSPVEKGVRSNFVQNCEHAEHTGALLAAHQQLEQKQPQEQWHTGLPYPPYQVTAYQQYPSIQHLQQNQDSVIPQQYLSLQRERQDAVSQSQATVVDARQTKQQSKQQPQQQIIPKFDQLKMQRLSQTAKKKYSDFTAEMIRDQELLVQNMRQQKIPETVMRRQFDTLLDEQRRHLAYNNGQEVAVTINRMQPRRSTRTLREDQRPDWMGRITPARMTLQPMDNFTGVTNQQNFRMCQEERRMDLQQVKQNDESQRDVTHDTANLSQYYKVPSHQLHNRNRRDPYRSCQRELASQQCGTGQPASSPYLNWSMPQITAQAIAGWSPQNNCPQSNPPCPPAQLTDFQTPCQHKLHQQTIHDQYQQPTPPRSQMSYGLEINHNQSTNYYNQTPTVKPPSPEQYQQCEKTMMENINGQCVSTSNVYTEQHVRHLKQADPTSLLKLKEFQKYTRPQSQFNGLQDTGTVKAALETLKSPEARKGLEYVAGLGKKVTPLKLNGTQDPSELTKIAPLPLEYLQRTQQQQQTKISSNGLCNTRNANNPPSFPIRFSKTVDQSPTVGYPRQYYPGEKPQVNITAQSSHRLPAEKEHDSFTGAAQTEQPGAVFVGYGPALDQNSPTPLLDQGQYPLQLLCSIDGRNQRPTIPSDASSPVKPQGAVPIMRYKFNALEPQCQQQMEQLHRNRLNLNKSSKSNIAALSYRPRMANPSAVVPWPSETCTGQLQLQPEVCSPTQTQPDCTPQLESTSMTKMVASSQQPAMLTYNPRDSANMVQNKEAVAQFHNVQQATNSSYHAQPEIRVPRTIGGLTYLARRADYFNNSPSIATNTPACNKFLQSSFS